MELLGLAGLGLVVYCVSALAQAITGFGLALAAIPLLVPVAGVVAAITSSVLVSIVLCGRVWWQERAAVDRAILTRTTVASAAGLPLGFIGLSVVPERDITLVIAAVILVSVVVLSIGKLPPLGPAGQFGGGLLSGALLTSTGLNGPPLVVAYQAAGLQPRSFRATLQASFVLQDAAALVGFLVLAKLDVAAVALGAGGVLGALLGWKVGDRIFARLDPAAFKRVVMVGLAITAAASATAVVL
ncbi:TSUP family transporter [Amycolatopsis jejuensis]|uniref:TSUP family transporter n=1 Tax=Amycolatopsis jejuensis TaxID=330084 RepID=UPI000AF228A9|nr:TSUP family transporter [Amycolatopsis jejuensis]